MNNIICRKILEITKNGITIETAGENLYIDFNECAKNFSSERGSVGMCVATRDITTLSFTFYTQPKTTVSFKKSFFEKLTIGKSATNKFYDMQKVIVNAGYTSYDLS